MQILCEVQHDLTSNETTIPHRVQVQGLPFRGAGLSLLVLRARANRGCPVLLRGRNKRAHWRAMVTINSLNYELIIHNYSRLADKHKPTANISQGGT